jgi:DNA-binding MarR family transcriptional regulator
MARAAALPAPRFAPPLSVTRAELLDGGSDGEFRRVIWGLLVVANRLPKFPEAFGRRLGISGAMYSVLIAAAHLQNGRGVGVGALAEHMHLPAPHVTTTVGKLAAKGLIAKRPNAADRRGVLVSLTRAGESALQRLAPYQSQVNDALFDGLTRGEFKTFAGFVERFVATTEKALGRVAELDRDRRR